MSATKNYARGLYGPSMPREKYKSKLGEMAALESSTTIESAITALRIAFAAHPQLLGLQVHNFRPDRTVLLWRHYLSGNFGYLASVHSEDLASFMINLLDELARLRSARQNGERT